MAPVPDPVRWLYDLQHFGIKLGLENIRSLLDLLENPQDGFANVHVAGTNGKGSVAAMLAAMLDAHGLRSGLFTSPHLVRPNERIRIAGQDIDTPALHARLNALRDLIEDGVARGALEVRPSFFEVITATALSEFRAAGVDAAVLEVGLGGRLDATNAVQGDVSVIVTVELDHMKTLGSTLPRIAAEKGGVIKRGRPTVSGVEGEEALDVIRTICRERRSTLIEARKAGDVHDGPGGTFAITTKTATYDGLKLSLAGLHQRDNARVAIVALETLLTERFDRRPDPERVRQGMANVRWAGRLQWIEGAPPLLLDGAHNAAGALTLADHLRERVADGPRPALLFGAMRGKDLGGLLGPLEGLVGPVVITRPGVERSLEPEDVAAAARRYLDPVEIVEQPEAALQRARDLVPPGSFLLIAGSLYLVGQVLSYLEPEPVPGPVSM